MSVISGLLRWIVGETPSQKGDLAVSPSDGLARIFRGAGVKILEDQGNKGVAGGYASLDGSGKVPTSQLPAAGGGLPAPGSSGMVVYNSAGGGSVAARTITGTSGRITVADGDGVGGPPVIDVGADVLLDTSAAGGDASGTLGALQIDVARGLRETSGPTVLSMGAMASGTLLGRVGSTLGGVAVGAGLLLSGGTLSPDSSVLALRSWVSAGYQPLNALLTSIAALTGAGLLVRKSDGTAQKRSITTTSPLVTITNPDGDAGNPIINVASGTGQDDDPTSSYSIAITPANATLTSRDGGITVRSSAAGNTSTRRGTALSGAFADFYTTNMNALQTRWTYSGSASFRVRLITGASIAATCRYKCGFTGGGLTSTDAETALRDTAIFRFLTGAGHTKWMCYSQNASGSVETDSGQVVAINTEYLLEIQINATQTVFMINGSIVATHTTYQPSTSQDLGFQCGVYSSGRTLTIVGARFGLEWA